MGRIRQDYDPPEGTGRFMRVDPKENLATITVKDEKGGTRDISGPETVWPNKKQQPIAALSEPLTQESPLVSLLEDSSTDAPLGPPAKPVAPEVARLPLEEGLPELVESLEYLLRQAPFTLAWSEKVSQGESLHVTYGQEEVWLLNPADLARMFNGLYQVLKNGPLPLTGAPPSTAAQFVLALLQ